MVLLSVNYLSDIYLILIESLIFVFYTKSDDSDVDIFFGDHYYIQFKF